MKKLSRALFYKISALFDKWDLKRKLSLNGIKKILVIKTAGIGDVVLSVPALRALRRKYPQATIVFLTIPRSKPIIEKCPYIDKIYTLDLDTYKVPKKLIKPSGYKQLFFLIKSLRREKIDILINLYHIFTLRGALRIFLFILFVRPRITAGRDTDGKGFFYDFKIQDSWFFECGYRKHEIELNLDLVRILLADTSDKSLELWITPNDEQCVLQDLKEMGVENGDTVIGISPGGIGNYKRWPKENFVQLIDSIQNKYQAKILILGADQDKGLIEEIEYLTKTKPISLVGRINLNLLPAVMKRLALLITNDSGPMHIAAAMKTPVIGLFGGGRPERYGPFQNEDRFIAIKKDVKCSPCFKINCNRLYCLKKILLNDVLAAVNKLLNFKETILQDISQNRLCMLVVTDLFFPDTFNGVGKVIYNISKGMAERGHNVIIFTRKINGLADYEEMEGLKIHRFDFGIHKGLIGTLKSVFIIRNLFAELLRNQRLNLIIIHQPYPSLGIMLTKLSAAIPKISYFHASWKDEYEVKVGLWNENQRFFSSAVKFMLYKPVSFIMSKLENIIVRSSNKIITLSSYSRDRVKQLYSLPDDKVAIIPGAVDVNTFKPGEDKIKIRKEINIPLDKFVLFTVRNLAPRTGVDILIKAMVRIAKEYNNVYLIIGGGGIWESKLKRQVRFYQLDDFVRFEGYIEEDKLTLYYQAADLFVLPTWKLEGFGLITLEALSSGIPVFGTPVGANVELISEFDENLLFKSVEADEIADKILTFIKTGGPNINFQKIKNTIIEKFTWEGVVELTEKIYLESANK